MSARQKMKILRLPAAVILLVAAAALAHAGPASVQSVSFQKSGAAERVIIRVAGDISWKSAVLGKSESTGNYRLYVDISGSQPTGKACRPAQPESVLIKALRVAPRDRQTTRVVIELSAPLKKNSYTVSRSSRGSQLIVHIPDAATKAGQKTAARDGAARQSNRRKDPGLFSAEKTATAPLSVSKSRSDGPADVPEATRQEPVPHRGASPAAVTASAPPEEAARPEKPAPATSPCTFVLDPGHGGKDPGATGWEGIEEKNVSLAIARELKKCLEAGGRCRVLMTRSADEFISLEERASLANRSRASLFISIHTNAHEDSRQRGTETYSLDFSSDADARRVAARENFTTPEAIGDLELILFDLLQSDKINRSSILAGHVHNALMRSLKAKYPDTRNLGVKHAPLKVLVDADMPCLILETAFLSNPVEAKRLQKPEHQRLLARAITEGVNSFLRDSQPAPRPRASVAEK